VRRLVLVCAALAVCVASAAQAGDSGSITGRVLVNPLSVTVDVPPDPVKAGRDFKITARVANAGTTALRNVDVLLVRDPAIVLRDPARQVLDPLGGGRAGKVTWTACSATPGSYVVLVRATTGPFTAESPGAVIEIRAPSRPC
jgi:CARDB